MNAAKLRGSHALLLPLLVVGAAATVFACAKPEPEAKRAWACESVDVPMGEAVRCTSSALIAESRYGTTTTQPVEEATPCDLNPESCGQPEEPTGGAGGTYECNAGDPECPPVGTVGESADPSGGAGGTEGSSGGGTGGTGDTTGDVGSVGGTSSSGGAGGDGTGTGTGGAGGDGTGTGTGGAGGDGTGTSGAGDTGDTGSNGNGNGGGSGSTGTGGASSSGGSGPVGTEGGSGVPDECKYVPELETCGGVGGGGTGGASGGSDCTKNNCDAPGQTKGGASSSSGSSGASSGGSTSSSSGSTSSSGGASSGGASSSGASSSGSGGHGGGRHYKCTKDGKGGATCVSTPSCVPGTHPAPCGACVPDGDDGADCVPPTQGGCWVTGGGFIEAPSLTPAAPADGHDNFGGNAKPMKDGAVKGHWNHVDHGTGNHAKGRPEYIYCRHVDEPGPGQPGGKKGFTMNQVYFGGPAEWRSNDVWSSGYWFDVVAKDHGEPGSHPHPKNGGMPDTYHFTIRKMDDPSKQVSGAIVYETRGNLSGGNVQMHPPNNGHPATQSALPSWVALED